MQIVQSVQVNTPQSTESSRSTPVPPEIAEQSSTAEDPSQTSETLASASSLKSNTLPASDKSREQLLKLIAALTEEKARAHEAFVADKKAAKVPLIKNANISKM